MANNIHVLYGEDEFSVKEALAAMKRDLGDQESLAANTATLDGKTLTFAELQMTCATLPFFAPARLIVVEGLLERFDGGGGRRGRRQAAEAKGKELGEFAGLGKLGESTPPTNVVVFLSGVIKATNPALEVLREIAQVKAVAPLRGRLLQDWIVAQTPKHSGSIDPGAARLLSEYSTGNLRQLDNDIEKLALYATGRPIQESDVRLLVHSSREARIFDLTDAAVQGRRADAVRALEQLFVQGEAAQMIITMLGRQLRMLVQAKVLLEANAPQSAIAEALATNSDWVVEKTIQQSSRYSLLTLKALYQRLLQADVSVKVGAVAEETAVTLFVTELAGAAR
ncbi:MAG: DNA polymerase III subunit delta [Chloroflexi bacterium]|nr:DNA polymerase III subunit delta [Chloroflexota bacterium]